MCYPIVETGAIVFNATRKSDIDLLGNIQNSFTRKLIIRCLQWIAIYFLMVLSSLRFWPPITKQAKKMADVTMMYKILVRKPSINTGNSVNGTLTKSVTGKLKLRISIAKSRVRSDFLNYIIL